MSQTQKRLLTGAVLLLSLAFWLYIAWCVPYTQDDWDWGLEIGMEQWLTASVNNRYVGNLFVILMTRALAAKVLILGGGMFLIPLLISLLVTPGEYGTRRPFLPLYCAANLLGLLLPPRIWRQTYGWVSGFANYGVSIVFLLLWLLLLQRAFLDEKEQWHKYIAILPIYTVFLALFLENMAVIDLLLALCFFLYALVAGRGRGLTFGVLVGAAVGCFIIFRNPLYGELAANGVALEGVRALIFPAGSTPPEIAWIVSDRLFGQLIPLLFQLGVVFPALLAFITLAALWQGPLRPLCVLSAWPMAYGMLETYFTGEVSYWFSFLGGIVSLIIPCLAVAVSGGPLPRRLLRLVLLLSGFGMIVPMALLYDMGGRLYVLFYFLTALVALEMAVPLLGKQVAFSGAMCACLSLAVMVQWGFAYTRIADCSALRKQLILEAVERGAQEVVIPTDRYNMIEWFRNPELPFRVFFYRDFYGIPQELKIIYLAPGSYEHWPEIWPQDWEGATNFGV